MDINEKISRKKPEVKKEEKKKEPNIIFNLECKVEKLSPDDFHFTGRTNATEMDEELMSIILAKIIKECVPEKAIDKVIEYTLKKLGLFDEENEPEVNVVKVDKNNIESVLSNIFNKILGE